MVFLPTCCLNINYDNFISFYFPNIRGKIVSCPFKTK